MNKIYKVIFNQALQVYQVVSELSKGHSKSSTPSAKRKDKCALQLLNARKLLLASAMAGFMISPVFADTIVPISGITQVQEGSNIILTESSDGTTLSIGVNPSITADTLTVGNTTIDASGLAITGGPSIQVSGIKAGGEKITNVSAGDISSVTSMDAVNGGQLFATNQNVAANTSDISGLKTRAAADETTIAANTSDISGLKTRAAADETTIAANTSDISGLKTRATADETKITANANDISGLKTRATTDETNIATNATHITALQTALQTTGIGVKYFRENSTGIDASASGTDAIAVGSSAVSSGTASIAAGISAVSSGTGAVAVGYSAAAAADNSLALGSAATVGSKTVNGVTTLTGGNQGIAIGDAASVTADNAIALGTTASAGGEGSIAFGGSANATSANSIAIGLSAVTDGVTGIAIGDGTQVSGASGVALGTSAKAGTDGTAIGDKTSAGTNGIALGLSASAGTNAIVLGTAASAGNGIALGTAAAANGDTSIALGASASTSGSNDISFGSSAGLGSTGTSTAKNQANRIALGTDAGQYVSGNEDIAIGLSAGNNVSGSYNIAIGSSAGGNTAGDNNVAIGWQANLTNATGSHSTAIGASTTAASGATAVGYLANAAGDNSIAIGYQSTSFTSSGVAIGVNATAADNSSIALGNDSYAIASDSSGNGYLTGTTSGVGVVSVGSSGANGQIFQRRITNVAAGSSAYDAVNVQQLQAAQTRVANLIGGNVTVNTNGTYSGITLTDNKNQTYTYSTVAAALNALSSGTINLLPSGTITYSDNTNADIKLAGTNGTTISNVANAVTSDQAVNLGQMKSAIAASSTKYFSVNSTVGGNSGNLGATGKDAIAIGGAVTAVGAESISMGYNTKAQGDNTIVLGNAVSATDRQTVAYDTSGVAIGTSASSTGSNSIAIGTYAQTGLQNSPTTTSNNAIAIGDYAEATADSAVALGQTAHASGLKAIAQGYTASATGTSAIAMGTGTMASGTSSTALGSYVTVSASNSGAIGSTMLGKTNGTTLSGADTYAIGNGDTISAANSSVVGNASTVYSNNSSITGNSNSIGQIVPTDNTGLNYATISTVNSSIVGNSNTVTALNSDVIGNSNIVGKVDTTYATSYDYATGSGILGNSNTLTGSNDRIIGNNNVVSDLSDVFILGNSVTAGMGNSVYLGTGSAYVAASDASNTTEGISTYNGVTIGNGNYTFSGTASAGVVTVGSVGSTRRIQNVSAGLISPSSTDAVNGSQLYALTQPLRFAGDNSTVSNTSAASSSDKNVIQRGSDQAIQIIGGASATNLSSNNIGVTANTSTNTLAVQLAKDLTGLSSVTTGNTVMNTNGLVITNGPSITAGGINAGGNKITNVAAGTVSATSTDAVNGSQLNAVSTVANKGWNTTAAATGTGTVSGSSTATVAPGATVTTTAGNNIAIIQNGTNLTIATNPNLISTSLTTGNTTVNTNGLSITGGPSVTASGINAGGNKITNVAAGIVSATSTDAVNGSQLNAVSTVANEGWNLTSNGAAGSKSNVAPGSTVDFSNTDGNVTISNTGNAVKVNLASKLTLGSGSGAVIADGTAGTVNAGTKVSLNGSTGTGVIGNVTITGSGSMGTVNGLTNKAWDPNAIVSGQAATEDQLKSASNTLTNNGLNFAGNDGNSIHKNLGDTLNIVGGYSGSGTTSSKNLKTVKDANGNLEIQMADDTVLHSVTTGNTVVNTNGVTIGTGSTAVSLTNGGLNNGGNKITNVAAGKDQTDAVNVGQLQTAIAGSKTTVSDGTNTHVTSFTAADGHTDYQVNLNDTVTLGSGADAVTLDGTKGTIQAGTNVVLDGVNGTGKIGNVTINGNGSAGTVNGLTNKTWDPNNYVSGQAATEDQLKLAASTVTRAGLNFAGNDGTVIHKNLGDQLNIVGGYNGTGTTSSTNVKTVKNNDGNLEIQMADNAVFNSLITGSTVMNNSGITIGSGSSAVSLTNTGLNNGGQKITNVANGTADNDAVNVSQLNTAAAKAATTVSDGTNTHVTSFTAADGHTDYQVNLNDTVTLGSGADAVTLDGTKGTIQAGTNVVLDGVNGTAKIGNVTINGNDSAGTVNGLTNKTWDPNNYVSGQAATEDQLKLAASTVTSAGLDFAGNDGTVIHKNLGDRLNIVGGYTGSGTTSSKNIKTVRNQNGDLEIQMADDAVFNSLTTGNTVMNTNGVIIGTGDTAVSLSNTGLNNGGNKITNVANGTADNDAVNVSQLNKAAAGSKTTVSNGVNTTVSLSVDPMDGHTDYQVNLNKDINVDSVTAGNTKMDTQGLTTADGKGNSTSVTAVGVTTKDANGNTTSVTGNGVSIVGSNGKNVSLTSSGLDNGGNTITNVAAGVNGTDAVNVDQLNDTVGKAAATAKSTVSEGKNITVTSTVNPTDGHTDYNVALNDTVTLGSGANAVTMDGTKGTVTAGTGDNAVTMNGSNGTIQAGTKVSLDGANGTGKIGNVTINGSGSTGTINGLTNKTWDPKNYTSGQGATEDQLKVLDSRTVQYNLNSDGSVDNSKITLGGTQGTTITNVAAGKLSSDSTDAVNGSQLYATNQAVINNSQNISLLGNSISNLDTRVDKVGAGAAALAALHPLDFDPDDKWDFAAGYGNYSGASAAAIGAYYRPNEDTMFSIGGSIGNGENMINAGVSFKLGQGNHISTSRVAMAKELKDMRAVVAQQAEQIQKLTAVVNTLVGMQAVKPNSTVMFPDVPENHWAYETIKAMAAQGLIEGYPDGTFGGDRTMTRYEFAQIIYRVLQKGIPVDSKLVSEFKPELERIRVDTISKDKNGNPTIERVRVNTVY
ncbi:ESPR-type extended signal peptide-containing protein [Megasphaera sueciensis]|uniref:ESPR-type extended signal peptide-containing protein n=1 Tax=Megasphaera sueciensis TaxID=349094 RepID=UPI003D0501EA